MLQTKKFYKAFNPKQKKRFDLETRRQVLLF